MFGDSLLLALHLHLHLYSPLHLHLKLHLPFSGGGRRMRRQLLLSLSLAISQLSSSRGGFPIPRRIGQFFILHTYLAAHAPQLVSGK